MHDMRRDCPLFYGYEPVVTLMSSVATAHAKMMQIANEYREIAELACNVLSDPLSEARYRAGCLTNYQRNLGVRAPFEQISCLDTELYIMSFVKTQGEDRAMSAAGGIQERAGRGRWIKSPRTWDNTPNLYLVLNVQPGCTRAECERAKKQIMIRTSEHWI